MRGRKPVPSRMHELRGDPGKRHRSREGEPTPDLLVRVPKPPRYLTARAAAVWRETAPELVRMRLMAKIDTGLFAGYCSAAARYQEAEEHLKTEPWTTSTARGGARPNPWIKISDDSLARMQKLASEFGLSPSNRARIKFTGSPKQLSLLDELMNDAYDDGERPSAATLN